jgi:hypothetical protein
MMVIRISPALDHDAIGLKRIMISLFTHDLFEKPVPTFPDHALAQAASDFADLS